MEVKYPYVQLKELCNVNQGLQIPISKRFKEKDKNRYFYITVQFLKESFKEKYYVESPPKSTICTKNDILVVRTGNTGQLITGVHGCFHNNFFKINNDESKVLNKFLYYCLTTNAKQKEMNKRAGVTTIPDLNHFMFLDLKIPLPPLKRQRKSCYLLDIINKKITINNKINAELEAMAKQLYDYWFVQFDFPDANGKPYKSSGGAMVYNEVLKREIPVGWEVKKLGDWIKKYKGGDWGKKEETGNYIKKVMCVRGADINGLKGNGQLKTPIRYILEKNTHKVLDPHDLIVEISGGSPTQSTGRLGYVINETLARFQAPLICSNFCKVITLKEKHHFYNFIHLWERLYEHNVLFSYEGKTSGIKNLLFDSFTNSQMTLMPTDVKMKEFYTFRAKIEQKKQLHLQQNQQLKELRDWLLPMLMNGQVVVE